MSGRKGRPMTLYRKDMFEREAEAQERAAFQRGEYQADPEKWPCPDGPYCKQGCQLVQPCRTCGEALRLNGGWKHVRPLRLREQHGVLL